MFLFFPIVKRKKKISKIFRWTRWWRISSGQSFVENIEAANRRKSNEDRFELVSFRFSKRDVLNFHHNPQSKIGDEQFFFCHISARKIAVLLPVMEFQSIFPLLPFVQIEVQVVSTFPRLIIGPFPCLVME